MCDAPALTDLSSPDLRKDDSPDTSHSHNHNHNVKSGRQSGSSVSANDIAHAAKQNQVGTVMLFGVPIVSLIMDGKERLCLAQISSTLLKEFSYNEIHNRRVALGITCIQCTPVQLEILRRAGAMPVTSRRCGMITRREAERLCQSFLGDHAPPQLPENFAFDVYHECAWGCRGAFVPSRYNSSRAKCIRCSFCQLFFSPNKFIFHSHRLPESRYVQPDAANFNSWRRHLKLCGDPPEELSDSPHVSSHFGQKDSQSQATPSTPHVSTMPNAQIVHAWEDVKAMFNGGTRKRLLAAHSLPSSHSTPTSHSNSRKNSGKNHSNSHGHNSSTQPSLPNNNSHRSGTPQNSRSQHNNHSIHNSQHPHSLLHESHHANNFPLATTAPLLSSSAGRLENIWNPGLSSSPPTSRQINPQMPNPGTISGTLPLAFHPLSIPWLRRPLFPFSHPFGPTCKLLESPSMTMDNLNLPTASRINNNQSAFKPVARTAEHLFSWLNNNNVLNMNSGCGSIMGIPEDLSIHSGNERSPSIHVDNGSPLMTAQVGHSSSDSSVHTEEGQGICSARNLRTPRESDSTETDDENVDIESTDECRGPFWFPAAMHSNLLSKKKRSGESEDDSECHLASRNNNNHEQVNHSKSSAKRKRFWDCDRGQTTEQTDIRPSPVDEDSP